MANAATNHSSNGGTKNGGAGGSMEGAVAVMVIVTVAGFAPGVTLGGLKEHALSEGSPVHENMMALLNAPFCGVMVSVAVAGCPRITVIVLEEMETL